MNGKNQYQNTLRNEEIEILEKKTKQNNVIVNNALGIKSGNNDLVINYGVVNVEIKNNPELKKKRRPKSIKLVSINDSKVDVFNELRDIYKEAEHRIKTLSQKKSTVKSNLFIVKDFNKDDVIDNGVKRSMSNEVNRELKMNKKIFDSCNTEITCYLLDKCSKFNSIYYRENRVININRFVNIHLAKNESKLFSKFKSINCDIDLNNFKTKPDFGEPVEKIGYVYNKDVNAFKKFMVYDFKNYKNYL